MAGIDYSKPDPRLLERLKTASDEELARYLENAELHLPETQWFVDAIIGEQTERGGFRNFNAHSVREVILKYARAGETCFYKTIADELGVPWNKIHRLLPDVLRQVSEMEHQYGRPMLTAIVVSQKGSCGEGFFKMARRNGRSFLDEATFQREEQERVFAQWREA